MTIRTKRRGRRSLAAILAAMLMASVLAVVATAPAQAANTSSEALVDTNNDGKGDTRQFAGAHRYLTAQYLADAFASQAGSPSSVVIASGETEVDAVTAAGLAGNLDAPILLTRANMLPHNVARYIDNHNVTHVVVVGGTAVVSDAVIATLEGLGSRPTVERIGEADRYATAAAVGNRLGGPNPTWCGSTQNAAVLVNGGDAGRADAIAISPIANNLGLPVLLTMADELPQSTVNFLTDNKVEHVVIVGGMGAVSEAVRSDLVEEVGVVSTRRIAGTDAAATSVQIAQEMLGKCAPVMGTDTTMVALVNRDATPDGVAAGPAMGFGLGNGPVPVLLVGDTLPSAVSDYLAGTTEETAAGMKTHLSIVAVGGTAVVSDAVMDAAKAAAKTSPALTAAINFKQDTVAPIDNSKFSVTFSDDVQMAKVTDPNLYRINGRRLEADPDPDDDTTTPDADEATILLHQIHVERRTVTVDLVHDLKAGDVVSVVGGGMVGDNGDKRPLEAASLTISLTAAAADRNAPKVEIVAVAGRSQFTVFVTEPNLLKNPDGTVYMAPSGISVEKGISTNAAVAISSTTAVAADATGRPGGAARYTVATDVALQKGHVIDVARNMFYDKGNRGNSRTRLTVKDPSSAFAITNVSIGNVSAVDQASGTIDNDNSSADENIVVTAKAGGAADGSAGNGWKIFGYDLPTRNATKPVDIDVNVDMKHKIVSYTVKNGAPTVLHLAKALSGNTDFAATFSLSYDPAATTQSHLTLVGNTDPAAVELTGGTSRVAVKVTFNDAIENLASGNALAAAIVGQTTLPDYDSNSLTTNLSVSTLFVTEDHSVWYTYVSDELAAAHKLPVRGGTRVIPTNMADNYHATSACGPQGVTCATGETANTETSDDSASAIIRSLRPDSSLKPF